MVIILSFSFIIYDIFWDIKYYVEKNRHLSVPVKSAVMESTALHYDSVQDNKSLKGC